MKSMPWVKHAKLDNPSSTAGVVGRMALEVLLFRSLFRNTKMELYGGPKITYHWRSGCGWQDLLFTGPFS